MSNEISLLLSRAASAEASQTGQAFDAANNSPLQAFENIHNLRDRGGLRSRDGRRVRSGRLFRSGNPAMASAADIARLRTLGLDAVVDFRSPKKSPLKKADLPMRSAGWRCRCWKAA